MVEFAVNNKVYLVTRVSLFIANYRRELRMEVNIRRQKKMEKAMKFTEKMKKVWEKAEVVKHVKLGH